MSQTITSAIASAETALSAVQTLELHDSGAVAGDGLSLCCPHCRGGLDPSNGELWTCTECHRSYPVQGGIPDLRVFESFYGSRERERSIVQTLLEAYPTASFAELVRLRFGSNYNLPENLSRLNEQYRLHGAARGVERLAQVERLLTQAGRSLPAGGAALEIGCGTGGMLVSLAQRFPAVAGIDINMIDLILAKKQVEEQGLQNVTLACACAEALPFQAETFRFVEALDLIEHVESQPAVVAEGYRILEHGGIFWFSSPNRYFLYGPEWHVRVWGVGFVPRRWQNAYVKLRKGVEYRGKRLLSRFELVRLLREAGIQDYVIGNPSPVVDLSRPARTRSGRLARRYAPWLARLINWSTIYLGNEYAVITSKA